MAAQTPGEERTPTPSTCMAPRGGPSSPQDVSHQDLSKALSLALLLHLDSATRILTRVLATSAPGFNSVRLVRGSMELKTDEVGP